MNGEYRLVSLFGSGVIKAVKARKIISSLLTGIGCIILFVGLAGFVLPRIDNPQMKLVLSSFQQPSGNFFIRQMNGGMNLAMKHCFPMLLIGSGVLAGGVLLTLSLRTDEEAQALRQRRAAASPAPYTRPVADTAPVFQASPVPGPPADNPFARPAAATSSPDDVQPSVPTVSNPFARPAGEPAVIPAQVEENPFARYIPADALPKSTPRKKTAAAGPAPASAAPEVKAAADPAVVSAAAKPAEAEEPALPAAQEPEALPVEAVAEPAGEPDAYAAYQRPAEAIVEEIVEEVPPVASAQPEETAAPAASPEPVTPVKEEPVSLHKPAPTPAAALSPRPLIRSTFRNSTPAQHEETDAAASGSPAPLQPSSRIKSTMGRKR